MTIKEAIEYIILKSKEDESLLTDTKRFFEFLTDLASEHRKELNVIKRSLDSDFLALCFKDKGEIKQRVLKMKYMLEDQGVGENWIDFILYSFFTPLGLEFSLTKHLQFSNKQLQQTSSQITWICSCGVVNNGNFCGNCGTAKSILKSLDWTCSCGIVNTTNFCTNCGQQKGLQQTQQLQKKTSKKADKKTSTETTKTTKKYIEVSLDKKVLKQLGYQVKYKNEGNIFDSLLSFKKNGEDVTEVEIPSTYTYNGKKYKITQIGSGAFADCSSLTSVIIPNSVTQIGAYAFAGCSSLTNITIPNSVTKIGYAAFYYCSSLTSVNIPNGVTEIDVNVFCECSSLTNIIIPNSVTIIDEYAFSHCESLKSVTIPSSVAEIRYGAFSYCISLPDLMIPNSVTLISGDAFGEVSHIEYHGTAIGAPWGANAMN